MRAQRDGMGGFGGTRAVVEVELDTQYRHGEMKGREVKEWDRTVLRC